MNDAGQVIYRDIYTTSGLTYSTSQTIGTAGIDYLRTEFGYDNRGRQARVKRPDGTWTHSVYDGLGRLVSTWKGTDNTGWTQTDPSNGGANEMVKVSENIYDDAGIGDSNLTESKQFADGSTSYSTVYKYDERNRLTAMRGPDNVAVHYTLDNLGQQTQIDTFADSDTDFATGDTTQLRGRTTQSFDERGQLYQTSIYEVDSATGASPGTLRDRLTTNFWYDARGYQIKTMSPSGLFDKIFYDSAGRVTRTTVSVDPAEGITEYTKADDLASDQVIEQNDFWIDAGGRTRITTNWKREGIESSGTTGAMSTSNSGYHTSVVYWYDAADRVVAVADYGRDGSEYSAGTKYVWNSGAYIDGDSDGIPTIIDGAQDATPGHSNISSAFDYDWIYTGYTYDAAGRVQLVTDNADRDVKTVYDLAGRTLQVFENHIDGTLVESDTDKDRLTEYVYDNFGRLKELKAYNAKGSNGGSTTDNIDVQVTTYLYASNIDRSWVSHTLYPDTTTTYSVDGTGKATITSGTDHQSQTYDFLGRTITSTDQRGVVHTFTYDSAGRLWADAVTSFGGTGIVDDTVKRIQYSYDDLSRTEVVTSFDSSTAPTTPTPRPGTALNELMHTYDGWGNVIKTIQDHDGAIGGGEPFIEYIYADGAASGEAKYVRLDTTNYPNNNGTTKGTFVNDYDDSTDVGKGLVRLESLRDGNNTELIKYEFIGINLLMNKTYHPQISGGMQHNNGTESSGYAGFDRYGRQRKVQWQNTSGSTNMEQFNYLWDRMGNRLAYDYNPSSATSVWDEEYVYDGLNRLVEFKRGTATTDRDGDGRGDVVTTVKFSQQWTLDSLGNWAGYNQTNNDTGLLSGVPTFSQTRGTNSANEITSLSGPSWSATAYDASGSMTQSPKTGSEATPLYFKYDGWNRLAGMSLNTAASDGGTMDFADTGEVRYEYDGYGRRITKDYAGGSTNDEDFYFNENYQVVEVRKNNDTDAAQRFLWDVIYIDAPAMVELDTNTDGTRDFRLWPTFDGNFNVTSLVTDQGKVVERYAYTPYGERIILNGSRNYADSGADADGSAFTVDTNGSDYSYGGSGFQGLWFDAETGQWYQRARYNSPVLGFTQRDKIGYAGGTMNLLGFVGQNPVKYVDPTGELRHGPQHHTVGSGLSSLFGGGFGGGGAGVLRTTGAPYSASGGVNAGFASSRLAPRLVPFGTIDALGTLLDTSAKTQTDTATQRRRSCFCTITLVPRKGGNVYHNWFASQISGNNYDVKVTTPKIYGITTTAVYDGKIGDEVFDAKTRHEWLSPASTATNWNVWHQIRYVDTELQLVRFESVAKICGLDFQVYTDTQAAADGINAAFRPRPLTRDAVVPHYRPEAPSPGRSVRVFE